MYYISYLANDRDIKGVLVNNYMLKKYGSKYAYKCICLSNVDINTKSLLKYNGIEVIIKNFEEFMNQRNINEDIKEILREKAWWGKLMIFDIVKSNEKFVYLDADIYIQKNLDILSTISVSFNELYMVNDFALSGNVKMNDFNLLIKKKEFNSGVIIYGENNITDMILDVLQNISVDTIKKMYGDQAILNYLFSQRQINIKPLKFYFNMWPQFINLFDMNNLIKKEDIYIVHYVCENKPWENTLMLRTFFYQEEKEYYVLWNKIYSDFLTECIYVNKDKMKIHNVFES